jgi:membrane-anchored protein YejM (alkaline phosphatase superfamily)
MQNFLGVTNDITDYSIGNNLFVSNKNEKCHVVIRQGQYGNYSLGIIDEKQTLQINPNASYNILNNVNRLLFDTSIKLKTLNKGLEYMTRFIKK